MIPFAPGFFKPTGSPYIFLDLFDGSGGIDGRSPNTGGVWTDEAFDNGLISSGVIAKTTSSLLEGTASIASTTVPLTIALDASLGSHTSEDINEAWFGVVDSGALRRFQIIFSYNTYGSKTVAVSIRKYDTGVYADEQVYLESPAPLTTSYRVIATLGSDGATVTWSVVNLSSEAVLASGSYSSGQTLSPSTEYIKVLLDMNSFLGNEINLTNVDRVAVYV